MSHKPFDRVADAHRRIADAHKEALSAHKVRVRKSTTPSGSSPELREKLIDATEGLLAERSVSAITTRDIARAAGLSDGVLYNYFADKNDLVVAALMRRFDAYLAEYDAGLPEAGMGELEENLVAYAEAWSTLAGTFLPTIFGLMSEPDLMHRFFSEIHGGEYGVRQAFGRISDYLAREQTLGRLGAFDVSAAVTMLTGSMMALRFAGMVGGVADQQPPVASREQIRGIVRMLLDGLGK